MSDSRLRFRVWTGGVMSSESWVDCSLPPAELERVFAEIKARHHQVAMECARDGRSFETEVYDPAGELLPTGFRFSEPHAGKVTAVVGGNAPEELDQSGLLHALQQASRYVI